MPIDASIYSQLQAPDIIGSIQRGLSARDMIDQRNQRKKDQQAQDAIKQAYQNNLVQNPDGSVGFNQGNLVKDLYAVNPEKGMQAQQMFAQQDAQAQKSKMEKHAYDVEHVARVAPGIKDQASYDSALKYLKDANVDVSMMDPDYTKAKPLVDRYAGAALSYKDQLAQQNQDRQFGLDQSKFNQSTNQFNKNYKLEQDKLAQSKDLKEQELGIKQQQIEQKLAQGPPLPADKKQIVSSLATKNANKISIKNQIDAVLGSWDKLAPDQKVTAGRQLLKTLNSTEGADAIGKEEAERLGAKLEFAYGNFTNSNPTQFGRDLDGFKQQAQLVADSIGKAVQSNQSEIDKAMGRVAGAPSVGHKQDGYVYMGGDPSSPDSWKPMTANRGK